MGYYCTVPQCTSLAGKTKNVKFHRFPRDVTMADKWNIILKRGKPYTKYSKVCSLHFTQADYNVTTMGQWKTLSKDALPSQNLPKLNPDGTVMVIRKSRTVKYKESKKDDGSIEKSEKWSPLSVMSHTHTTSTPTGVPENLHADVQESLAYRLQSLSALANHIAPQQPHHNQTLSHSPHAQNPAPQEKPKKQDAIMQTDPLQTDDEENQTNHTNNSHSETSETSYTSDQLDSYSVSTQYQKNSKNYDNKNYEMPKDYTKSNEDYIPQTNEEYNKEAEKYALERKSHNGYEKPALDAGYQKSVPIENGYQKQVPIENGYQKVADVYSGYNEKQQDYHNREDNYVGYQNGYQDSADILRNQQHNLQILQEQHRVTENQNFFNENHIKQEIDLGGEDDKFLYERAKEQLDSSSLYSECQRRAMQQQRLMDHLQHQLKQEPDGNNGCDSVMQPQGSPYYGTNGHTSVTAGYYDQVSRPGPELLIAKQNALAAHTQLWQNTVKRPFFYSETTHYNAPQLLHRYEDLTKILQ